MANSFFNGLGLSLGAKLVSINDRPSYFSIIFRPFYKRRREKKIRHILHESVGGTPRHVCRIIRAKSLRSDLPAFNITQNLAKKLDPRLKPSNLKEITYLAHFYAQKSKHPRRF